MLLSLYIGELLFLHNCVIVPNFGAFLAKNRPAQISEDQKKIHPPFKEISFNRQVKNNDGLLASHIASKEGISFDEACNRIANQVHLLQQELTIKRTCVLDGLGVFRITSDTNLMFEASNKINFSRAAFGLQTVVLPLQIQNELASFSADVPQYTTEVFSLSEDLEKVSNQTPLKPEEESQKEIPSLEDTTQKTPKVLYGVFSSYKVVAASLVLGIGSWLSYAYLEHSHEQKQVNLQVEAAQMVRQEIQKASFVFEVKSPLSLLSLDAPKEKQQKITTSHKAISKKQQQVSVISSKSSKKNKVLSTGVKSPVSKPAIVKKLHTPSFSVVAGAFRDRINADKMVLKLQKEGYKSSYIGKNRLGLHQVAYQCFSSKLEAVKYLSKIKTSVNKSAWILVQS